MSSPINLLTQYWFASRAPNSGKYIYIVNCAYYQELAQPTAIVQNGVPEDPTGYLDFILAPDGFDDPNKYQLSDRGQAIRYEFPCVAMVQTNNGVEQPKIAMFM